MADALGTPGVVVSDEDHRLDQAGLIAPQTSTLDVRTGVLVAPGTTALVTGTSATGTMTVAIAAHHWVTSRATADGVYVGTLEAATTVNIAAAPGANSRIDVVYVKQNDTGSTVSPDTGTTAPLYGVATGTAAVSPTKPSIPVGAIELATVQVAVGATSTNGAGVTITNTARQTVMRGAPVPARTQAERDALTGYVGLRAARLDRGGRHDRHDGTAWRSTAEIMVVTNEADASALSPLAGDQVFATATGAFGVYDGTAWRWHDTAWRDYTPTISTGGVAITVGNATRYGRYYRTGRSVQVQGFFSVGSTTAYPGGNGVLRADYPTGLRPRRSGATGFSLPTGQCTVVGSVTRNGWVAHEDIALEADRRMVFVDASNAALQGGSSAVWNVNLVGHSVGWGANYEIT